MSQRNRHTPAHRRRQASGDADAPAGGDGGEANRTEAARRLRSIDAALERAAQVDAATFLDQSRQTGGQ